MSRSRKAARRGGIVIAAIAAFLAIAALVGFLIPQVIHRHPPAYAKPLTGTVIGVREPDSPKSFAMVRQFTQQVGVRPNVTVYYSSWWEPFRTSYAQTAYGNGTTVLVQIEPFNVPLSKIADGSQDWYLRAYAEAVRSFGHLVIISFAPEMNGSWAPWDAHHHTPPGVWVAAWRHVVTLFRNRGAHNVTWLWDASTGVHPIESMLAWWPGDRYVDWIGLDGYYYKTQDSFARKFAPSVAAMRRLTDKPILLAEVGIGPVAGQATMLPDLFRGIEKRQLLGLVWFDVHQTNPPIHQNWRLEGHPAAVSVFRREVQQLRREQAGR